MSPKRPASSQNEMINTDRLTGLFFLVFSLYVCFESWRLGIGSFFRPGAGFFPFYSSLLLGILALGLMLLTFWRKLERGESWVNLGNILLVLLSMLGFALLLDWLGFLGTAFLFICFLLYVVERRGWLFSVGAAFLTSATCYVAFDLWLKAQLPAGILGR